MIKTLERTGSISRVDIYYCLLLAFENINVNDGLIHHGVDPLDDFVVSMLSMLL